MRIGDRVKLNCDIRYRYVYKIQTGEIGEVVNLKNGDPLVAFERYSHFDAVPVLEEYCEVIQ